MFEVRLFFDHYLHFPLIATYGLIRIAQCYGFPYIQQDISHSIMMEMENEKYLLEKYDKVG